MKVIISAPHLDQRQKAAFEDSIRKAAPSIARRIGGQAPQDPLLRAQLTTDGLSSAGRVVHHLTLSIQLPDHPIVVHKSNPDLQNLIDDAEQAIKREAQRARSRIRRDQLRRRRRETRQAFGAFAAELPALPPLNGRRITPGDLEVNPIFLRLRPLLEPLMKYAKDLIDSAVSAGEIPDAYLSPEDLVDHAVLKIADDDRSVMQDPERLEQKLYAWVDKLIIQETKERHSGAEDMISLEQDAPQKEKDHMAVENPEIDENEFYQPFAALRIEDILIDENAEDPEQAMSDAEQRRLVLKYLGSFHSKARSAFYLNRVEGFEPYEIAMIQNRDEPSVCVDIDKCLLALREGWSKIADQRVRHEAMHAPRPGRADVRV